MKWLSKLKNWFLKNRTWVVKIGNGYYMNRENSIVTFILDDASDVQNRATIFGKKSEAKNVAREIGGVVDTLKNTTLSKHMIFNEENIEIVLLTQSQFQLLRFFRRHFRSKKNTTIKCLKSKIEILSAIEDDTLKYGISRVKSLEHVYDVSANFGYYFTLLLAFVATFSDSNTLMYNAFYGENAYENSEIIFTVIIAPIIMLTILGTIIIAIGSFCSTKIQQLIFIRSMLEKSIGEKNSKKNSE